VRGQYITTREAMVVDGRLHPEGEIVNIYMLLMAIAKEARDFQF
jgi:hypothetical protein